MTRWLSPRRVALATLRGRLDFLLGGLVVVVSAGLSVVVPSIVDRSAQGALEGQAHAIATMTAYAISSAVEHGDPERVRAGLARAARAGDAGQVVGLRVVAADGEVARWELAEGRADALRVVVPVTTAAGDTAAHLLATVSRAGLTQQVRRLRGMMAAFSLVLLVTGLLVAWVLTHRPAEAFERMAERLHASQRRLEDILEGLPAPVAVFDHELRCVYHNRAAVGWPARPVPAERDPALFWEQLAAPPETIARMQAGLQRSMESGVAAYIEETLPGPPERTFLFFASPFGKGSHAGVIGYGANVTELKEAQKALARSEERLLQAQKMEAVGRLAGGVAHDFNNLLTVIGGNVDLLRMEKDGDPLLDEVAEATARAAALTTQLLAFSRKQVVKLEQLDPDEVLAGVKMLLHRLIGEDVELVTDFGVCGRGCVTMDRGQLGQIVMNLAVNARDAMPHGGRLLIQTRLAPEAPVGRERHAHDGAWVVLEIGDTGTGMDALTRARIFEPFFTTKPTGEGTGLGLATVYAIVTEISGWIDVESEPGNGTTFRIWLPAHPVASPAPANEEEEEPSGSERILVVEDEPAVRALVVRLLEQVGYTVLAVSDPVSALAYFAPDLPSPDLLLTDVVLPGMNGRQLADQLRQTVGDLRVLFMSGYTDDAVVVRGVLSDEMAFVQKPFSRATLARAVREALDAPRPRWGRSGHERAAAWASRA